MANALGDTPVGQSSYTPQTFAQVYQPAINYAATQLKVDPSVIAGQRGEETGWGKSTAGSNNFGNLKTAGAEQHRCYRTDNQTGTTDNYQSFSDPMAFAKQYVNLIQTRYPTAVGASNAQAFGQSLYNGGYAQDQNYSSKLAEAATTVAGFLTGSSNANANESTSNNPLGDTPITQTQQSNNSNSPNNPNSLGDTPQQSDNQNDPYGDNLIAQANTQVQQPQGPQNPAGGVGTAGLLGHANTIGAGLLGGAGQELSSLYQNAKTFAQQTVAGNNLLNSQPDALSGQPAQPQPSMTSQTAPIATANQAAGQAQRQTIQNWQDINGGQTTSGKVSSAIGATLPYLAGAAIAPEVEAPAALEALGGIGNGIGKVAVSAFNGVKTTALANAGQAANDTVANGGSASDAAAAAAASAHEAITNPINRVMGPAGDLVGSAVGKVAGMLPSDINAGLSATNKALATTGSDAEIAAASKIKAAIDNSSTEDSGAVAHQLQTNGQSNIAGVQKTAGQAVLDDYGHTISPTISNSEQGAAASQYGDAIQSQKAANTQAVAQNYNDVALKSPTSEFNNAAQTVAASNNVPFTPVTPGDIAGMKSARDTLLNPIYDRVVTNAQNRIPVDDNLQSLLNTPAGQSALKNVETANANNQITSPIIDSIPASHVTTGQTYPTSIHPADLQMIKQELDTQARYNPMNPSSQNSQSAILNVKNGINNILKNQVTGYTGVNDLYRSMTAPISAADLLNDPAVQSAIAKGGPDAITNQIAKINANKSNPMHAASNVSDDTLSGLESLRDQLQYNKTKATNTTNAKNTFNDVTGNNTGTLSKLAANPTAHSIARTAVGSAVHAATGGASLLAFPLVDSLADRAVTATLNKRAGSNPAIVKAGADLLANAPKLGKMIELLNEKEALQAAKKASVSSVSNIARTATRAGLLGSLNEK